MTRTERRATKQDIRRRKACTKHHPEKETPMDRMAALAESLKEALPDVEIEHRVEEDEIYVNYDFSEAVVVEHNLDQRGVFVLTAVAWDRTGGVSAEHEIANTVAALVPLMIKRFLAQQEEQERKLDALLASRPEEY